MPILIINEETSKYINIFNFQEEGGKNVSLISTIQSLYHNQEVVISQ